MSWESPDFKLYHYADTYHDFGKNDKRCTMDLKIINNVLNGQLGYPNALGKNKIDEDKVIQEITSGQVDTIIQQGALEYLSEKTGKFGIVLDYAMGFRASSYTNPAANTQPASAIYNIHTIASAWDMATKKTKHIVKTRVETPSPGDFCKIEPMNIAFGSKPASTFIGRKTTNYLKLGNVEIDETILNAKILNLSVKNMCAAVNIVALEKDALTDAVLEQIIMTNFISNNQLTLAESLLSKAGPLRGGVTQQILKAFKTYYPVSQSQSLTYSHFINFIFDIKRSMDAGQVEITKVLSTNPRVEMTDENNRRLADVTPTTYVLMSSDRLCYTRARLQAVNAIMPKDFNKCHISIKPTSAEMEALITKLQEEIRGKTFGVIPNMLDIQYIVPDGETYPDMHNTYASQLNICSVNIQLLISTMNAGIDLLNDEIKKLVQPVTVATTVESQINSLKKLVHLLNINEQLCNLGATIDKLVIEYSNSFVEEKTSTNEILISSIHQINASNQSFVINEGDDDEAEDEEEDLEDLVLDTSHPNPLLPAWETIRLAFNDLKRKEKSKQIISPGDIAKIKAIPEQQMNTGMKIKITQKHSNFLRYAFSKSQIIKNFNYNDRFNKIDKKEIAFIERLKSTFTIRKSAYLVHDIPFNDTLWAVGRIFNVDIDNVFYMFRNTFNAPYDGGKSHIFNKFANLFYTYVSMATRGRGSDNRITMTDANVIIENYFSDAESQVDMYMTNLNNSILEVIKQITGESVGGGEDDMDQPPGSPTSSIHSTGSDDTQQFFPQSQSQSPIRSPPNSQLTPTEMDEDEDEDVVPLQVYEKVGLLYTYYKFMKTIDISGNQMSLNTDINPLRYQAKASEIAIAIYNYNQLALPISLPNDETSVNSIWQVVSDFFSDPIRRPSSEYLKYIKEHGHNIWFDSTNGGDYEYDILGMQIAPNYSITNTNIHTPIVKKQKIENAPKLVAYVVACTLTHQFCQIIRATSGGHIKHQKNKSTIHYYRNEKTAQLLQRATLARFLRR